MLDIERASEDDDRVTMINVESVNHMGTDRRPMRGGWLADEVLSTMTSIFNPEPEILLPGGHGEDSRVHSISACQSFHSDSLGCKMEEL